MESSQQRRYQRPEGLDPVRRRDENNDRNRESADVLLMLQILIGRQEDVELTSHQS